MNTTDSTDNITQLYNYHVVDTSGNKLGSVDGVWVDDATNRPEFVSVKTGWLFGKNHIIPIEQANVDNSNQTIQVPFDGDQIKNGPSYATDAELSPDDENQIYDYYGMQRSTAQSPTGYAAGGTGTAGYTTSGTDTTDRFATDQTSADAGTFETGATRDTLATEQDQINVPVSEEELQVGKREVEAGKVRLRKVVRTEQQEVPVELRREEIDIERVPASGQDVPGDAFQEREVEVPVSREEAVVGKEAHVTGEVRVGKNVETEQRTVGGEVRKEDVEVDRDVDTEVTDPNLRS